MTDAIFLGYQQEWLSNQASVKIWEKSRRIGATWAEAANACLNAASAKGVDVWYLAYNEAIAKEFIRDVAQWAKKLNLIAEEMEEVVIQDDRKDIKAFQVKFASGKRVTSLSSRPTNLRGRQGIAILDEFAFHDEPKELLKAALAFLVWGGKVRIISTHNGIESYFSELVNLCRAGKLKYSLQRTTLDDVLEQGLYKKICASSEKKWSQEKEDQWKQEIITQYGEGAQEELFCVPKDSSEGRYFPRYLVEKCMDASINVINLTKDNLFTAKSELIRLYETEDWLKDNIYPLFDTLNPLYKTSYGMDFGRLGDLSYLVILQEQPNLVKKTILALELRNIPFKQQEQILFYIGDRLPRFIAGAHDARGNGQYLSEVAAQRYGYRIHQVMLSNQWYLENFPKYKAAIEDKNIILPACSNLLDDHQAVMVEKGIPKVPDVKNKGTDGKYRHGDGAIAYCLAWFASCQNNRGMASMGSDSFDNW